MDWNLFWTAFGSIGSTIGSLITAIAVVVAVKQYKQPIEKKVIVSHSFAYPIGLDESKSREYISINIKNKGIRSIKINSVNVTNGKGRLYLNKIQSDLQPFSFPYNLEPEEAVSFYVERDKFLDEVKRISNNGVIKNYQKMRFMIEDSLEDTYIDKKKFMCRNGIVDKL